MQHSEKMSISRDVYQLGDKARSIVNEYMEGNNGLNLRETAAPWGRANIGFFIKTKTGKAYRRGEGGIPVRAEGNVVYQVRVDARVSTSEGPGAFVDWDPFEPRNDEKLVYLVEFTAEPMNDEARAASRMGQGYASQTFQINAHEEIVNWLRERFDMIMGAIFLVRLEDAAG